MKGFWTLALLLALTMAMSSTTSAAADEATGRARGQKSNVEAPTDSTRHVSSDLRLEDITIEGDVDIPRVLFIESRDHLRDHDYLTQLFLRSAAQVGTETPLQRILHWSPKGEQKPWTP